MLYLKEEWQRRRQKMLSEKIDITAFMEHPASDGWFGLRQRRTGIKNYPDSVKVMKWYIPALSGENPDYQYNFNVGN